MAKQKKFTSVETPKKASFPRGPQVNDEGGKFNHNALKDAENQFAPTDAEPLRQRYQMGGGC